MDMVGPPLRVTPGGRGILRKKENLTGRGLQEKPSREDAWRPYRKPPLVGKREYAKAFE